MPALKEGSNEFAEVGKSADEVEILNDEKDQIIKIVTKLFLNIRYI